MIPPDGPPSYDAATGQTKFSEIVNTQPQAHIHPTDVKVPLSKDSSVVPTPPSLPIAGPSYQTPTVYHYVNPKTGERVVSLLPPDHPQMICLQAGEHKTETRFGFLGVLAAIVWFPLGIGLCLLDRRVHCTRCGQVIDHGVCG